ncbi:MAG: sulfite exporter TauE/SafE family protein [Desulfovibrionaceae bacterium]|nr:sulfite exporter TauE/SafE family protein [Desulfovibrionaceae bacterium]
MTEVLLKGFMLGLATGPACMASCFPVLLPVVIGGVEGRGGLEPIRGKVSSWYSWGIMARFLSGRAAAYLALGLLAGFLGGSLGIRGYMLALIASLVMSLLMIAYGLGLPIAHLRTCAVLSRFVGKANLPLVLGFLTSFNMCPPLLLAMSVCMSIDQGVLSGALFFLAFFIASALYMLPAGVAKVFRFFGPYAMNTGRFAAVFVGLFFFWHSAWRLWPLL